LALSVQLSPDEALPAQVNWLKVKERQAVEKHTSATIFALLTSLNFDF
jgi:hypothetical protein